MHKIIILTEFDELQDLLDKSLVLGILNFIVRHGQIMVCVTDAKLQMRCSDVQKGLGT